MHGKTLLAEQVTDFLASMGIGAGEQSPDYRLEVAYRMGYEDCMRNHAVWQNGEQLVGALQTPLRTMLDRFKNSEVPCRY